MADPQKIKEEEEEKTHARYKEIISSLPQDKGWATEHIYQYQGYWFQPTFGLEGVMAAQEHFKALPTDIILTSTPKSGTTWLKALIFTLMNRSSFSYSTHPLLTTSPHQCVPFLELHLYRNKSFINPDIIPSPRLFATHIPYILLPESVIRSDCRIVYVCRDPKDVFVSLWHFMNKFRSKELSPLILEETFQLFCNGVSPFGPFWDHVLGYWNASLEWPKRVLFLKYEDMKREPFVVVKKLAEFIGKPFSMDDEDCDKEMEEIIKLCSFENLSTLEVNKTGQYRAGVKNDVFFRQAEVGDWENHLTAEMGRKLDRITEEKLMGSNLNF